MNKGNPLELSNQVVLEESGLTWGEGYDSIGLATKYNTALTPESIKPITADKTNTNAKVMLTLCESKNSLDTNLSASTQAEANIMGVKVKGAASLATQTDFTENSLAVLITARVNTSGQMLDNENIALLPKALERLQTKGPADFYEYYGNYFMYQTVNGGELVLMLTTTFSSYEEKIKATASLSVTVVAGNSGKAKMSLAITHIMSDYRMEVYSYQSGAIVTPTLKPADMVDYAFKFVDKIQSGDSVVFKNIYAPYYQFAGSDGLRLKNLLRPHEVVSQNYVRAVYNYRQAIDGFTNLVNESIGPHAQLSTFKQEAELAANTLINTFRDNAGTLTLTKLPELYSKAGIKPPSYYQQIISSYTVGTVVNWNDNIYLEYMDQTFIQAAKYVYIGTMPTASEWVPHLGEAGTAATLQLVSNGAGSTVGSINSNSITHIRTTEADVGDANLLGEFYGESDVYYHSPNLGYPSRQQWVIRKLNPSEGPILYNEPITLASNWTNGLMQRRGPNDNGVWATSGTNEYWIIRKAF